MGRLDIFNLLVLVVEVLQFLFIVLELWVRLSELLKIVLRLSHPKPGVGCEAFQELADAVLCALD